jgi:hypothetical protein
MKLTQLRKELGLTDKDKYIKVDILKQMLKNKDRLN